VPYYCNNCKRETFERYCCIPEEFDLNDNNNRDKYKTKIIKITHNYQYDTDVGGYTFFYLKTHPEVRYKKIHHHAFKEKSKYDNPEHINQLDIPIKVKDFLQEEFNLFRRINSEIIGIEKYSIKGRGIWIHYKGGGNWEHKRKRFYDRKLPAFKKIFEN